MNLKLQRQLYALQEAATDDKTGGGGAASAAGATPGATGGGSGSDTNGATGGGAPAGGSDAGTTTTADDGKAASGGDGGAGASDGAGKGAQGAWGDDWRQKIAGDDAGLIKRLERYTDPKAAIGALAQLQEKISKGELRAILPKNATPEQVAEWRASIGVPADPTKYEIKAVTVDEASKPIIDAFTAEAHKANFTNEQVNAGLEFLRKNAARMADERHAKDQELDRQVHETLRDTWGNADYRTNIAAIDNLMTTLPKDVADLFKGGRLADGTPLMAHVGTLTWLADMSRQVNPIHTIVPAGQGGNTGSIEAELKENSKMRRENNEAWVKDEKRQARERDIIDALLKSGKTQDDIEKMRQ